VSTKGYSDSPQQSGIKKDRYTHRLCFEEQFNNNNNNSNNNNNNNNNSNNTTELARTQEKRREEKRRDTVERHDHGQPCGSIVFSGSRAHPSVSLQVLYYNARGWTSLFVC